MTALEFAEIFLNIATGLGLLFGAASGGIAVWKYRADLKLAEKLRWHKATVQRIFQSSDEVVSFENIRIRYRSEAADLMGSKLKNDDISEENLRQILIDLCASSVVVQMGKDTYSINTYLGSLQAMRDTNVEIAAEQKKTFENQNKLLLEQLKVVKENQMTLEGVAEVQRRAFDR